ncbi:MAG: hypothetical protein ABS36_03225 [Acidobacteria bacterium SCN 69-37]|nr:MAG: hypothetical protein ABS36_03225 [Acidobacteria bacterium SCN 69-37]
MRRLIIAAGAVLVLVVANVGIHQREQLLATGRTVLLELAPVDPRSLMQGDYMALRFRVADAAFGGRPDETRRDGRLVLGLDAAGVGTFRRFDTGSALAPDEVAMRYRIRANQPTFATNAFFFQEGHAAYYEHARYGEFRVAPSGDALLVGVRGSQMEPLGPPP